MKRLLTLSLALCSFALLASCVYESAQAVDFDVFEFNDSNGTELMNAVNSVDPNRQWFSTNSGADMAPSSVESGSYRIIKDFNALAQNHLDIDNVTSGTIYLEATFSSWKFTGHDPANPEQVRLAFLDNDGTSGTNITAQMQIRRSPETDPNHPNYGRIELRGDAVGTAGSTDIVTLAPLNTEQTNPFTMVLALDQDSNSYEVFYKDGTNPTQVLGLGSISRARDANSVRLAANNNFGSTNLFPTVIDEQVNIDRIAISDTNPFTDLITAEVNRDTGAITLTNTSGAVISGIESYSITSAIGGLDSSEWRSVTGNYDSTGGTGDGSVDSDDLWMVTSSTTSELSEAMQTGNGDPEDGGSLGIGQSVVLDSSTGSAPGVWIKSPFEDLQMVLNLSGGASRTVDINFVGNGGSRWTIGDLDFDNDIDTDDWLTFIANAETDLSSFSAAQAYSRGDLDSDGVNSVFDFEIFKNAYNAANPLSSFEEMIAGIPEPSSAALALLAVAGLSLSRRKGSRGTTMKHHSITCKLLAPMFLVASLSQLSHAGILEEFLFDDGAGTAIESAANNVNPGNNFDVDADNTGVVTNGLGQLNASLKSNTNFGTNYVDNTAVTTGIVYGVMELTWDFMSTLDPAENEQVRVSLINSDPRSTEITAEFRIERTDADQIVINGQAGGAGSSDISNVVLNGGSLTQSTKFIGVVAANLDNSTYEVFFSNDAGSSFQSIGTANSSPGRIVESMRMALNNDLSNDNVLIDRVYLTDVNPVPSVDKLTLEVNSTTGQLTLRNDSSVAFDIDNYRIESPTDDLNFSGWNSLSDQEYDAIDGPDPNSIAGDGVGETWDEAGGSDDGILSESFLLGSSVLDPNESVSIGQGFKVGGDLSMLTFQYRDAVTGNLLDGDIVEVTGGSADFDSDGKVDGIDFLTWQTGFGLTGQIDNSNGDADGDGTVTSADLVLWQNQYGTTTLTGAVSAVPEPATISLVSFLLASTLLAYRRVPRS